MKRAFILVLCLLLLMLLGGGAYVFYTTQILPAREYAYAQELFSAGYYTEAGKLFTNLGAFTDSASRAEECRTLLAQQSLQAEYEAAEQLYETGNLLDAAAAFEALGDYSDAALKAEEARTTYLQAEYDAADALWESGSYPEAIAAFEALGDFADAADRAAATPPAPDPAERDCSVNYSHLFALNAEDNTMVCTKCGYVHEWATQIVPEDMLEGTDQKGSYTIMKYETKNYRDGNLTPLEHELYVYLPYGYDENVRYNLLIRYLGGSGLASDLRMSQLRLYSDTYFVEECDFWDSMIAHGYCDPFIVIAYDSAGHYTDQLVPEFINDVYPLVIENFSVYAESASYEDMIAAREHVAMQGTSNGAMATVTCGLGKLTEYMAYFSIASDCNSAGHATDGTQNIEKNRDFPVKFCIISSGGFKDWQEQNTYDLYVTLGKTVMFEGRNNLARYVCTNWGHVANMHWLTMYNALMLFYRCA